MPLMAQGTQDAKVVDIYLRDSKGGNPYLVVSLENESGHSEWTGFFSEAAWPITEQGLRAFGWNPPDHNNDIDDLLTSRPFLGKTFTVTVKHETYSSEGRAPKTTARASIGNFALSSAEAKVFAASLRQKIAGWSGRAGSSQPVSGAATPAPADALPF